MNNRLRLLSLGLGAAILTGCSMAPRYERPIAPIGAAFPSLLGTGSIDSSGPSGSQTTLAPVSVQQLEWRGFYRDERLHALITLALANNRDLRVAALNIERAQVLYRIQRTALVPTLEGSGGLTRKRTPGDVSGKGYSALADTYSVGLTVPSYELDFFGRVASLRDQVLEQYLASEEAATSARISLISSVARQYFTLLAAQEQLALARSSFEAAESNFRLSEQTYRAGVSSEIDYRTSESQFESYRASVASLTTTVARAENALVLLLGCPLPKELPAGLPVGAQIVVEELPPGLPSELLLRRPDIRQAEHTLLAANANIGVARAAFFPSVKLTASYGTSSTEFDGLFGPGSKSWTFAPSITLPIFAAGKNKATLDAAQVQKRIEVANYEKAIQTAFREVADALALRATIAVQISAQQARADAARRRYELTEQLFRAGSASSLNVLLAQQDFNAAQTALVDARLSRLLNLSTLYAALGGGWQADQPQTK